MRLDKFLQISRVIKQRNRAKELCAMGSVFLNEKPAKASNTVQEGDRIRVIRGDREIEAEIVEIPIGNVSKQRSKEIIHVTGDRWLNEGE